MRTKLGIDGYLNDSRRFKVRLFATIFGTVAQATRVRHEELRVSIVR
jgi:hypothetical protein